MPAIVKRGAVVCPQCGKSMDSAADPRYRPFCSERCKLADLGQWFSGRYSIPADPEPEAPPPEPKTRQ